MTKGLAMKSWDRLSMVESLETCSPKLTKANGFFNNFAGPFSACFAATFSTVSALFIFVHASAPMPPLGYH